MMITVSLKVLEEVRLPTGKKYSEIQEVQGKRCPGSSMSGFPGLPL